METQLETKGLQDQHWLNVAEIVAVAGSFGGIVGGFLLQEAILASIPLSACVALNLVNRKRLLNLVITKNDRAIATLTQQHKNDTANLGDQISQLQKSVDQYAETSGQLQRVSSNANEKINQLEQEQEQVSAEIKKLAQIQTYSEPVGDADNPTEIYCRNGDGFEQLGELQKAIQEYTKAIKSDSNCAQAYYGRGLLHSQLGNKQTAVKDLRQAAKLYFDCGDIDRYQKSKKATEDVHQLNHNDDRPDSERLLASGLFS